jgi:hydroxymethylbilane synthase
MSSRGRTLRLATSTAALACGRAERVREQLEGRRLSVELIELAADPTGDTTTPLDQRRFAVVQRLDQLVLDGEADGAVHAMQATPTDRPPELVVAGIPERGAAQDRLVTPEGTPLAELPDGATIGATSRRRRAQLRDRRPEVTVTALAGTLEQQVEQLLLPQLVDEHERRLATADAKDGTENKEEDRDEHKTEGEGDSVDTRSPAEWLASLSPIERRAVERGPTVAGSNQPQTPVDDADEGEGEGMREETTDRPGAREQTHDALCLAEAALARRGLLEQVPTQQLDPTAFVPAPAQGGVAVTARDGDTAELIHEAIDHPPTRVAVTVERTVRSAIGGGQAAPVGVYARLRGAVVSTTARVLAPDGAEQVQGSRDLAVERHAQAAETFGADLRDRGAGDLLAAAADTEESA